MLGSERFPEIETMFLGFTERNAGAVLTLHNLNLSLQEQSLGLYLGQLYVRITFEFYNHLHRCIL